VAARSGRRSGGFRGNLLGVPQALPDDEATTASTTGETPKRGRQDLLTEPTARPDTTWAESSVNDENPDALPKEAEPANAEDVHGRRKTAPSTIRLNDPAGSALWNAYIEAKTRDPFLSYRQFASAVVLHGIAATKA
jgi:hypothetical protein